MKRILFFILSLSIFACNSSYQSKENPKKGNDAPKMENAPTYIVKTVQNFNTALFREAGAVYDGEKPMTNLLIDGEFYTVTKANNIEEKDFIAKLEDVEGVYYVNRDREVAPPKFFEGRKSGLETLGLDDGNLDGDTEAALYEYALRITKARNWYNDDKQEQEGAYKAVGYGTKPVVVAIIDSGVNFNHHDFKKNNKDSICLYAKTFFGTKDENYKELNKFRLLGTKDNKVSNEDALGHGTHCAGTMCALEGNSKKNSGYYNKGIAGVSYKNTHLISYQVFSPTYRGSSKGIFTALSDLAEIVDILKKEPNIRTSEDKAKIPETVPEDFKITQKVVPVNMSLGDIVLEDYQTEMWNLALSKDILPVVAMGNDGRIQPDYPRSLYGCIPVGATDHHDKRTTFSNAGDELSVVAPGFDIISLSNGQWAGPNKVPSSDVAGVNFKSGTSMAAPFVTGLIGYLLSFDQGHTLTPLQMKRVLEETADKIDQNNQPFGNYVNGHSIYYGYGRVNVLEAAKCVKGNMDGKALPTAGSFYLETPFTVTVTPPVGSTKQVKVRLYEVTTDVGLIPQGVAFTDKTNKKAMFYGLKKDGNYKVTCYVDGMLKEHTFQANTGSMEHTFN
ncbi:MAG: dentilisin complex serine proteinase subunit PrtP [Treponema sp.]